MSLLTKLEKTFFDTDSHLEKSELKHDVESQWNELKTDGKKFWNKAKDRAEDTLHGEPSFRKKVSREFRDAGVAFNKYLTDLKNFCENRLLPALVDAKEEITQSVRDLISAISSYMSKSQKPEPSRSR